MTEQNGKVAIIGDEDTVTGFLLAGIGERNSQSQTNFLVVDDNTKHDELISKFKELTTRDDISIILITQPVAQDIRYILENYDKTIPVVLEIPSKDKPYSEADDPIIQRVIKLLGGRD